MLAYHQQITKQGNHVYLWSIRYINPRVRYFRSQKRLKGSLTDTETLKMHGSGDVRAKECVPCGRQTTGRAPEMERAQREIEMEKKGWRRKLVIQSESVTVKKKKVLSQWMSVFVFFEMTQGSARLKRDTGLYWHKGVPRGQIRSNWLATHLVCFSIKGLHDVDSERNRSGCVY